LRDPTHDLWKKHSYNLWDYKLFQKKPELLWRVWSEIDKAVSKVKPNIVHEILGQWQIEGKLGAVMTQNYDSANDKAALEKLIELEGSTFFATCLNCGTHHKRPYVQQKLLQAAPETMVYLPPSEKEQHPVDYSLPDDPEFMTEDEKKYVKVVKTPLCSRCFGPLKFDIPLHNEPRKGLPHLIALNEMRSAPQVFIGIGFHGLPEPSDLLPALARSYGAKVIFVNEEATDIDNQADIVVHGKIDDLIRDIDAAKSAAEKVNLMKT
jgi:NAD-dependent deacetylase